MTQQLTAPVTGVTVYPGQARIVRTGRITLPEATSGQTPAAQVVLGDLPLSLVQESVRVTGRGAGVIRGIDVRTIHRATDASASIAELLAQKQRWEVAAQEIADERRGLDLRVTMLELVAQEAGRPYARRLAAGLDPDELVPIGENIAAQLGEVLAQRRTLIDADRRIADELAKVERALEAVEPTPDRTEVAIAVGGQGEVELEVSYLVTGATWEPRYDLRLSEDEVEVTWLGTVRQWSGEDWPAVGLRLSTARPTAQITIPELDPWFVSERPTPRPMPVARAMAADMSAEVRMVGAPMAAPMAASEAGLEVGVTASTYVIEQPVAVSGDGSEHQAHITSLRWPAVVDYVTAPVRSDDVFLRASITNTSEHTLRAGRASLFHEAEFVGVSDLEVIAPGEEVELALGLADRVRVKRELVARHVDKSFLGGSARHEARWRTTLTNHTGAPVSVTVLDQAPVSRDPSITVREVKTTPEAAVDEVGEVTWRAELADGESAELELSVRVDVAKDVEMMGWRE